LTRQNRIAGRIHLRAMLMPRLLSARPSGSGSSADPPNVTVSQCFISYPPDAGYMAMWPNPAMTRLMTAPNKNGVGIKTALGPSCLYFGPILNGRMEGLVRAGCPRHSVRSEGSRPITRPTWVRYQPLTPGGICTAMRTPASVIKDAGGVSPVTQPNDHTPSLLPGAFCASYISARLQHR